MLIKLKTISCTASIAITMALLAACADSGQATGDNGEIIETGAAVANPPAAAAAAGSGAGTGVVAAPDTGTISVADTPVTCLLYTSPSPRDATLSRMPSSA